MDAPIERIVWNPPNYGVFVVGDVLVQSWQKETPASAFRAISKWCEARAVRSPGAPLWMVSIVSEESTMPDGDARKVAAEFPRYFDEFVMVVEGSGFRSSVVRSVLAGMSMIAPRRTTPQVVASLAEGASLLNRLSHGAVNASSLATIIAEQRSLLRGL